MKKKKYKILVLSDLKKSTGAVLKSSIGLAKIINGDITFFHVKNPSEVVSKESQLSAIRSLNHEHTRINKKIQNTIKSYCEDYTIRINHSFVFGNTKNEIGDYIKAHRPDIIVLGKKKSNPFNIIGDKITNFVLKEHDGAIMVVGEKSPLDPNKELSFGVLNVTKNTLNIGFADDLIAHSKKPLKSFRIAKKSNTSPISSSSTEIVEYVFEHGDNSMNNLSNYLSKNKINLLYVDRMKGTRNKIKDIMSNLNVSLLLTGK